MGKKTGTFYAVSVGPGDPELLTLQAVRTLERCAVIAAPQTASGHMLALDIARAAVDLRGKKILPLAFSMSTDAGTREACWRAAADAVEAALDAGDDVALVNLGDVSLYATAYYILDLIRADGYVAVMLPGVTSICAVAARLGRSLTRMEEPVHILPGSADLADALRLPGTKVLMKSGRAIREAVDAIAQAGLLDRAALVADCGLPTEQVCEDLRQLPEQLSYFATILVRRKGEQMEQKLPRLVIAGTNSGCGKTTVTCAVLQALVNRGLSVAAAKCGPDYIDPMFHSRIIGAKSANLDPFFFDEATLRYLLAQNAAGCAVTIIEGVMGYYDGLGLTTTRASTWETAQKTASPTVLVINARGAALSVLAAVQGFLQFQPHSGIRGVILNGCTAMSYAPLAKELEARFGIKACGYLPRLPACTLESRHLGLVTAAEVADLREKLQRLAAQAETSIDLDLLLRLANEAPPLAVCPPPLPEAGESVRIGVARDRAFCFYYEDSLALLSSLGAELVPFSPLEDPVLPEGLHGLYLGGGYPELSAAQLSENASMRESVRAAVQKGVPCIAECGGFMYLLDAIGSYPMAGALPGRSFDAGKLTRFGYLTLTAQRDNLLCRAGESIAAHEFHRWDADDPGEAFLAEKPSGRRWPCVHATGTLYAGYPHFHFYANPAFAANFLAACRKEKHRHA